MAVTLIQSGTEAQISKARVIGQLALFEGRRQCEGTGDGGVSCGGRVGP